MKLRNNPNKIKNFDINPTRGGNPALENNKRLVTIDCILLIKNRLVQPHRDLIVNAQFLSLLLSILPNKANKVKV